MGPITQFAWTIFLRTLAPISIMTTQVSCIGIVSFQQLKAVLDEQVLNVKNEKGYFA